MYYISAFFLTWIFNVMDFGYENYNVYLVHGYTQYVLFPGKGLEEHDYIC
jgi:hypothetical protein